MVRVSTIIPAFNAARFIGEAIESALAQTYDEHEVIVVDDGSTDDTPEILRSYGDRIRVITQENAGHVAARNSAASVARGEWLAFLDADDHWLPRKLEMQMNAARSGAAVVYTERENFGEIDRMPAVAARTEPLPEGNVFEQLLLGNFVTVSSAIIRREWFASVGGFDVKLRVCEDWDLWCRCAAAGGRFAAVAEPLTRYRWHHTSMSNNHVRMRDGRVEVVLRALATEIGKQVRPAVRRKAFAGAWACSAWYVQPSSRITAMQWYARSAMYWPWDAEVYKGMIKCLIGRL